VVCFFFCTKLLKKERSSTRQDVTKMVYKINHQAFLHLQPKKLFQKSLSTLASFQMTAANQVNLFLPLFEKKITSSKDFWLHC